GARSKEQQRTRRAGKPPGRWSDRREQAVNGARRKNSNCEFRNANCPPRRMNSTRNGNNGLLGTDLAAFREYAQRAARSIHPRVGSPGSAAALRGNTRRSVALSLIQAARAHFHSRSPFGTRRSASGESR